MIRAFEKVGWRVHEKPYLIRTAKRNLYADFGLQRANEDNLEQIIIMEVKCFTDPQTDLQELYTAIGQYQLYQNALTEHRIAYPLYLAIPQTAYERLTRDRGRDHSPGKD